MRVPAMYPDNIQQKVADSFSEGMFQLLLTARHCFWSLMEEKLLVFQDAAMFELCQCINKQPLCAYSKSFLHLECHSFFVTN